MATNFLPGRGLIVKIQLGRAGGAYEFESSELGSLIQEKGQPRKGVILIDNVTIEDQDEYAAVTAIDDYRLIFKFGKGFGQVTINATIYLPSTGCRGKSELVKKVQDAFDADRLSGDSNKPCKISIAGGAAYPFYPVKLNFIQADASNSTIKFAVAGVLAPVKSGSK